MADFSFTIIIKGFIFLWFSFLLKHIIWKFCVNRYILFPTFRPLIL